MQHEHIDQIKDVVLFVFCRTEIHSTRNITNARVERPAKICAYRPPEMVLLLSQGDAFQRREQRQVLGVSTQRTDLGAHIRIAHKVLSAFADGPLDALVCRLSAHE